MNSMKYMLRWLIEFTRGGVTRSEIIKAIHESPKNANQLSIAIKIDYKTARYHLRILEKNRIVTSVGHKYSATYFLSPTMNRNYTLVEEILKKTGNRKRMSDII